MAGHKVKTAVIGAGDWGKNHVRKFHELGSLAAICETNPDTCNAMKEQFGVDARSYDDILNDETINAIVLVTPALTHKELGLMALERGKHLFVE